MLISEGADRLEIVAIDRVPAHLPTPGDTKLSIAVESRGFTGRATTWVSAGDLAKFATALRALEMSRMGTAEIESMSPGEFRLRVSVTDRLGHMAVNGRVSMSGQQLEFAFSFCPTQLPSVVAEVSALACSQP